MATKGKQALLALFEKKDIKELKFQSTLAELSGCLNSVSLEPENLKVADFGPNDIVVQGKHFEKKKPTWKKDSKKEEKREKVYRKGPLAKFYQLNESTLDKDANVWFYKEGKQVIGPVSSYNMDKMVYLKTIQGQTRIAFKTIEKFVKLEKIMKIVEDNYKGSEDEDEEA